MGMEIIGCAGDRAEVMVKRVIRSGGKYNISASQGYLGIADGIVEVTCIGSIAELTSPDVDHATDYKQCIEAFIDADYTEDTTATLYGRGGRYATWVAYFYPYEDSPEGGDYYVFPLEEFVDHTSLY